MYRKISDFISDYQTEREKTRAAINCITNDSFSTKVYAEGMSLGELAFHIVQAVEKIASQIGVEFAGITQVEQPDSVEKIAELYAKVTNRLMEGVGLYEHDAALEKAYPVYGMTWTVGETLAILVKHEIHHRGQLMLFLRILGLPVPDIYGPAARK